MTKVSLLLLLLLSPHILLADSFLLGDAKRGQALHKKVCVACHTSSVYTRPDHQIKTIGGLIGRVNGCSLQLGLKLPKEKINDLVKHLNDTYYKFN